MSYCNFGDKPRVDYKFNGESGITYQSQISPIDVIIGSKPLNTTAKYDAQGYQISFPSPQGLFGRISVIVLDYQIFTYQGVDHIAYISCGGNSLPPLDPNSTATITGQISEDHTVHCPNASSGGGACTLTIFHQGTRLFETQGECPVSFTVACGDECPEGYCKIDCEAYPGYCCLNEAEIKSLSNQLR